MMLMASEGVENPLRFLVVAAYAPLLGAGHVRRDGGRDIPSRCRRRGGSSGRGRGCLLLPSRLLLRSLRCIFLGVARRFNMPGFVAVFALGTGGGTGLGLACGSNPLVRTSGV